jgi:hypothetical protein
VGVEYPGRGLMALPTVSVFYLVYCEVQLVRNQLNFIHARRDLLR